MDAIYCKVSENKQILIKSVYIVFNININSEKSSSNMDWSKRM